MTNLTNLDHEICSLLLHSFITILSEECDLNLRSFGNHALSDFLHGSLEPDNCYYVQHESHMRGVYHLDLTQHPPPDLIIEIDFDGHENSPVHLNLKIPEVWRYNGKDLFIYQWREAHYLKCQESCTFARLPVQTVIPKWIEESVHQGEITVFKMFRAWVREQVKHVSQGDAHQDVQENLKYIFLDIDGVLVKEDPPEAETDFKEETQFDSECLQTLEHVLRQFKHYYIVISSSWRELFPLEFIQSLFSKDISERVIGITPITNHPVKHFRYYEILEYLTEHHLEQTPWIAIDDIAVHFPPHAPVIITNAYIGFDTKAAEKLTDFLKK